MVEVFGDDDDSIAKRYIRSFTGPDFESIVDEHADVVETEDGSYCVAICTGLKLLDGVHDDDYVFPVRDIQSLALLPGNSIVARTSTSIRVSCFASSQMPLHQCNVGCSALLCVPSSCCQLLWCTFHVRQAGWLLCLE